MIQILLADDHQIIRDGLRALLEKEPGMKVIAEATNSHSAIELAEKLRPDIAIMDLTMPDLNGIEAARRICASDKKTRVMILSMHSDRRFIAEALKAGSSAYLLKDCAFEELIVAIRMVMKDQIYLSPQIAKVVLKDYMKGLQFENLSVFNLLSGRERQVLQMIAEGKTSKEIAADLKISLKTVETFRRRIMEKLDLDNLADLVKYAIREGLTSLE
jgi:two-component system, NarL family, response regulator NreC